MLANLDHLVFFTCTQALYPFVRNTDSFVYFSFRPALAKTVQR